jgi:hypothetical protein
MIKMSNEEITSMMSAAAAKAAAKIKAARDAKAAATKEGK